jgi:hypothetical protein
MRRQQNQQGLASIVIVGVLVILLALITLGFSKIMGRAVNNALNNQLSAAASYAAQSAINDAMAYIKGQDSPDDVSSSDCTTLLKQPGLSNLVDLSGDGNTKITCLLVNPRPTDLMYQQLAPNGSQIVKATTSDAVDKMMVSWQASNGTNNSLPGTLSFPDVPTWNTAGNVPVVRLGLYPVPPDGKISGIQAASKTFFLVPGTGSGAAQVTAIPYSTPDGSVVQANCNAKNTGINGLTADYVCNIIINGLYANILPDSYYYLTITPLYNQADVKIKANNVQNQAVEFISVQTVIDATAKANNAAKRLQERVDSNISGDNIAASEDAVPDYAIRSAKALCKQLELHKSYYDYILNNAPATCNSGGSGIPTVAPTLTLKITGNDGTDAGTTRDSGDATPGGSGYSGAVYINSAATVSWKSTDSAYDCTASGGWSGNKNDSSSWSGVTGTGSQSFSGISRYTNYNLTCHGPGGATPTKTVTAWPPPRVSISGPGSFNAGDSYTISWSAVNASKCTVSSTGNNSWEQTYTGLNPANTVGDSRSFGTSWQDHSTKNYTIKCWDASGREDRADAGSWSVGVGGADTTIRPPRCSASASFSGNTTDNAYIRWSASCPEVDPYGGGNNYYIDTNVPNIGSGYTSGTYGTGGNVKIEQAGDFHFQIYTWAPGWKSQSDASGFGSTSGDGEANSGRKTVTVYKPLEVFGVGSDGVWDHGAQGTCDFPPTNPNNIYNNTWQCRFNQQTLGGGELGCGQGPPSQNHRWTTCFVFWRTRGGSDSITCRAGVAGYGWPDTAMGNGGTQTQFHSNGSDLYWQTGNEGWTGAGLVTNFIRVHCQDSAGQQADGRD